MQAHLDKEELENTLLLNGFVKLPNVLSRESCEELMSAYD